MIDPIKRAVITVCIAAIIITGAFLVPSIKGSKLGDFLQGAAVGAVSVAALMVVIAIFQRPNKASGA